MCVRSAGRHGVPTSPGPRRGRMPGRRIQSASTTTCRHACEGTAARQPLCGFAGQECGCARVLVHAMVRQGPWHIRRHPDDLFLVPNSRRHARPSHCRANRSTHARTHALPSDAEAAPSLAQDRSRDRLPRACGLGRPRATRRRCGLVQFM